MLFYLVIFLIAHSLLPLVGCVLARYFKGEVCKPAVFCGTMPMLHVGRNVDDCAGEDFLHRFPFLLIPATSGYTYQLLPAALCGVVRVPVVTATRLKGYVEERYLTVGTPGMGSTLIDCPGANEVTVFSSKSYSVLPYDNLQPLFSFRKRA